MADHHEQGARPEANSSGKPLRVLQVVEASLTGVGRHCLDLCGGLARRGCEVDLIYSPVRMDNGFKRLLEEVSALPNLNVVELPMKRSIGLGDLSSAWAVRSHLKKHGPFDVVHGHSSKGGAIVRLAAFGRRVSTVYTPNAIRTMNPLVSAKGKWVVKQIEKLLATVPGKIVAVSTEEQEHIEQLGISPQKLALIPNGINPIDLPSREDARSALGLKEDWLIAGFIGRMSEQKGIDVLIRSLPDLVGKVEGFRLVLIGEGELTDELKQLADELGVADSILWLGQQPGFQSMPAFDLFVLPSRYEGLPYVLLEALMAGLPVVTTDLASSSMLIESNVNGLVVPAESPKPLADAIVHVLDNTELRRKFAEEAAMRAVNFTLDHMVEKTIDLYRELAKK